MSLLRRTLSAYSTYPYSFFGRLNAADSNRKFIQIQRQRLPTDTRHSNGHLEAVAFSVILMAHIEKQLLNASPYKALVWERFIDDIFPVWTISETDFINFANSFHATIKFTHEMSSKHIVFLDTEVCKGSRFIQQFGSMPVLEEAKTTVYVTNHNMITMAMAIFKTYKMADKGEERVLTEILVYSCFIEPFICLLLTMNWEVP